MTPDFPPYWTDINNLSDFQDKNRKFSGKYTKFPLDVGNGYSPWVPRESFQCIQNRVNF